MEVEWKSPQSVYWKALIGCEETGILINGSCCGSLVVQEVTQVESGLAHGFVFRGTTSEDGETSANAKKCWDRSWVGKQDVCL